MYQELQPQQTFDVQTIPEEDVSFRQEITTRLGALAHEAREGVKGFLQSRANLGRNVLALAGVTAALGGGAGVVAEAAQGHSRQERRAQIESTPSRFTYTKQTPNLPSVPHMNRQCIAVTVNQYRSPHAKKEGVTIRTTKGMISVAGESHFAVKYDWHLKRNDKFCGIAGGRYLNEESLEPTRKTAHGGEYIDDSVVDQKEGRDMIGEFIVYVRKAAHHHIQPKRSIQHKA